uniref:Uncharacterized protein n=1 Tax=Zea mays TaxID=4577 RepID=A0A804UHM3_MAIZE
MRTAGRSYNCVRGSVTNMSPSVLPGPSRQQDQAVITPAGVRPRMAWRAGGSRHRACCSSSRAKASLSVSVRPCFAICSGGQGQPTRPVALLCVRRPPAMRVASAAVHAFNSIQTGEACRISPSGRGRDGGWFLRAELSGFRNQERECESCLRATSGCNAIGAAATSMWCAAHTQR